MWQRQSAAVVALILVAGLAASVAGALAIRRTNHNDTHARFDESSIQLDRAVQAELGDYIEKLRDIGAHAVNSPPRQPDNFANYIDGTRLFEQLPAASGVFFLRRVEESDLPAYERTLEEEGHSLFVLGESPAGSAHYILEQYTAGAVDLQLPLYADITPLTGVSEVLKAAGERQIGTAGSFQNDPFIASLAETTGYPIPLLDQMLAMDFFIGVPVYDTSPEAGGTPVGWVGATVSDFADITSSLMDKTPAGYGLRLSVDLINSTGVANDQYVRASSNPGAAGSPEAATFTGDFDFETEGVPWHLAVWSPNDADPTSNLVLLTFIAGALTTLLVARLVQARARSRRREREHGFAIEESERFQTEILDSVTEPLVVLDQAGQIVQHNQAWDRSIGGGTAADLLASDGDDARPPSYLEAVATLTGPRRPTELGEAIVRVLGGESDTVEFDVLCNDGQKTWWWLIRVTPLRGERGGAVVTHSDITERKRSHDDLAMLAACDSLTGLPNRRTFVANLDHTLDVGRLEEEHVGLIFIDLDGFKPINDEYGHAAGDTVLQTVASRLTSSVRGTDGVARLGGDEFVILVSPFSGQTAIENTANRILAAFEQPVEVTGRHGSAWVSVRASIGAAVSEWTDTGDDLLARADRAMYRSKQLGGSRLTVG